MVSSSDPYADLDARASGLMKRGIGLLAGGRREAISEALACFDQALELRRRLPVDEVPAYAYGLAACWLNRAEALMAAGGREGIRAAIEALDEAIVLLRRLPLDDDPRFARRLAIAHQNRGLALQAASADDDVVIDAFIQAIATLDDVHSASTPDRDYLLAAMWTNLASLYASRFDHRTDRLAADAARRALGLIGGLEVEDAKAAEVGLNARHVICRTIAKRLTSSFGDASSAPPDDVHSATDLTDDGLEIVRRWEQRGVTSFRAVGVDLFRFGALVYATYQPQFVIEFVLENMDPQRSSVDYVRSDDMRAIADEALYACGLHRP